MRMGLDLADAVESPRCSASLRDWLTSDSESLAASPERFAACPATASPSCDRTSTSVNVLQDEVCGDPGHRWWVHSYCQLTGEHRGVYHPQVPRASHTQSIITDASPMADRSRERGGANGSRAVAVAILLPAPNRRITPVA